MFYDTIGGRRGAGRINSTAQDEIILVNYDYTSEDFWDALEAVSTEWPPKKWSILFSLEYSTVQIRITSVGLHSGVTQEEAKR